MYGLGTMLANLPVFSRCEGGTHTKVWKLVHISKLAKFSAKLTIFISLVDINPSSTPPWSSTAEHNSLENNQLATYY